MSKAVPQKNPSIASSVAAGCSPPYSRTSLESRGLGVTAAPNLAQATLSDQQAHCHSMCQSSPLQDSHVIHAAVHPLSSILTFDAQYPWGCDVHRSLGLPALSTPTGHSLCYWPNDSGVSIQQQFTCNPTCAGLQGSWSADSVQLLQQQQQQCNSRHCSSRSSSFSSTHCSSRHCITTCNRCSHSLRFKPSRPLMQLHKLKCNSSHTQKQRCILRCRCRCSRQQTPPLIMCRHHRLMWLQLDSSSTKHNQAP